MENWHVKLDREKAIDTKKQLLSSEINLLHIMRHMKNYSVLRKRELDTRNKLRTNISLLKTKINLSLSNLPKEGIKPKLESKIQKVKKIVKQEEKSDFQKELEEIQAKLAKLG